MTVLVQGRPVTTRVATLTVDPGMPVGVHRFQLVVVDTSGQSSRPDVALVRITARVAGPTGALPPSPPIVRRRRSP